MGPRPRERWRCLFWRTPCDFGMSNPTAQHREPDRWTQQRGACGNEWPPAQARSGSNSSSSARSAPGAVGDPVPTASPSRARLAPMDATRVSSPGEVEVYSCQTTATTDFVCCVPAGAGATVTAGAAAGGATANQPRLAGRLLRAAMDGRAARQVLAQLPSTRGRGSPAAGPGGGRQACQGHRRPRGARRRRKPRRSFRRQRDVRGLEAARAGAGRVWAAARRLQAW